NPGKRGSGADRQNNRATNRKRRPRVRHPKSRRRYWKRLGGRLNESLPEQGGHVGHREGDSGKGLHSNAQIQDPPSQTPTERARWRQETASGFRAYFNSLYKWSQEGDGSQEGSPKETIPGFRFCGTISHRFHAKTLQGSKWGEKLCQVYPVLAEKTAGFGWPQLGSKAERQSLNLQAGRRLERTQSALIPSQENRESVIERTVQAYSSCYTEGPACTRDGKLTWESFQVDFKEAVMSLELDAGIGLPYIAYGQPTHRGWVENPDLLPILAQLAFDRAQKLSEVNFEGMSPEELVRQGLVDPIRLFIKKEPHKTAKLIEGRYRLIMSVSLVDQIIARILFQNQNKREICLWRAVPSKPGFGLSTDEQISEFVNNLAQTCGVSAEEVITSWQKYVLPTDCSGFDWSVSQWMLEDELEVRNRLTLDLTPLCARLRKAWLYCLGHSVFALTDGTLLAQELPGVQKSGSYNTSSSNSRIRVMAAFHAGASWAMAMGDDALESPDGDLSIYKQLGFKVEVGEQLEFCSHVFKAPNLAIPVNFGKMLYRLIHSYEPECGNLEVLRCYLQALHSVLYEIRHDPDQVSELLSQLSPSVVAN
ncbi:putative RNA polymerase, partial [Dregea volubilis polerovirus 1]